MKTKEIDLTKIVKTKKELAERSNISSIHYMISTIHTATAREFNIELANHIGIGTDKFVGDNKGQWGYIPNSNISNLLTILDRLNIKSIVDLGSGCGILLWLLRYYMYLLYKKNLTYVGYEIEKPLVEIGRNNNIIKANILNLTKTDVSAFEAIYFYEPLRDKELAKKFANNLESIMNPGQYILYERAGVIYDYLLNCKTIKYIGHYGNSLHVFIKL